VCSRPATDGSPDWMEKIMRELRDDELEKVSGGLDAAKMK
jgi:bacteriocin-like protein